MATYTMTPAERRARARAIVEARRNNTLYNLYKQRQPTAVSYKNTEVEEKKEENDNFFVRGLETVGDLFGNVVSGAVKGVEGIVDLGAGIVGGVGGIFSDDFQDDVQNFIKKDYTSEFVANPLNEFFDDSYIKDCGIVEGVASGIGQMLPAVIATIATYGTYGAAAAGTSAAQVAAAAQAASLATTAVSAAGNTTESAYKDGAGYYKGLGYGIASGAVEAGTEKLFGGATKNIFGKGALDNVGKEIADTGIKKVVKGALEEGAEEIVAELANPALKSIYKGKDAFSEYGSSDYWKGVGEAGIVGSLTGLAYSNTIGYGVAKMTGQYTGKAADINDCLIAIKNQKEIQKIKKDKLWADGHDSPTNDTRIAENVKGNYKSIETVLKKAKDAKRAELIKEFSLEEAFEADGSMKADFAASLELNNQSEQTSLDKRYVSPDLQGKSQKVAETLTSTTEDLRRKYMETNKVSYEQAAEAVKEVKAFKGDMTDNAKKSYSKLKKGLNYLNTLSGKRVNLVVTEAHDSFNGSLLDDTIYIGADTFESDTWAETLVHEYTHFAEGTKEYQELMDALTGDSKLVEKTLADIFEKAGYGFDKEKTQDLLKRYNRLQNSKNKTANIDSQEEIRYNRKNDFVEGVESNGEENRIEQREREHRGTTFDGRSDRWGSLSTSTNTERVRRISAIIEERKRERIKRNSKNIYSQARTETQEILSWHAEKENIKLYFIEPNDNIKLYDFYNDILYLYETATEKEFVDILNIVKPIKRNVDYNKVAHISKERWDKFLEWHPDAYITRIPIQQFLDMTTDSYVTQRQINAFSSKISEKVDVNDIKNTSGEYIYLEVDLASGSVVGHEGRHRMTALLNNGNGYADVFVIFTTETGNELYRHLEINGQYNNQTYSVSLVKADSKQFSSLINKIKNIDDGNIRYNLKSTQNESETKRDTSSVNDTVDNEVLEELTEDELKYIRLYKSELGAHLSANMLGTESFIDKLVRENTTIAEKILNKLSDLKQMFERLGDAEARAEYKKIKKAEKLYLSAVEKAGYAYVGRKIVGAINEREEESKFNYKDDNEPEKQFQADYEKNVDAVLNGTYTGDNVIVVGRTPKVLTDIGLNQLPLAITANHIYTIAKTEAEAKAEGRYSKNNNYHGLGETAVKQIREKIKEPVMVLTHQEVTPEQQKSHAQSKRIVVVVELVIDGKQVICPIEVDTSLKYDGGRIDSNLITTYFSKSTFNELLKECIAKENIGETGFYYINKTKANNLLQGPGYQLPQQLASRLSASNTIIRHISENVNRKISDFTQSQQFKRWFGDWQNMPNRASKVVNSDGTPKIVYHGTDEKFTVFDITKSRSYDETVNYDLPGFYFSESLDESSSYGNIGEYYISIKNPYDGDIYKLAKEKGSYRKAYDYLVSKGYDGVIITELGEGFTEYIVFKPEQIKSATDNIGTFDRGNPDIRFNLKSNGKITKSRGEYQKLKADYTKKKKYDKKDVSKAVLDVPYISTLPKATQNDIIESMWYSLNTIESDNQKERFINLCYNGILRDLWQESKSFAELSTDEIREIEQKLYKTVRNIVKIGGSPSYLSKVEAQYAKTEAGRWRKKFLEAEEWKKIVGLLMSRAKKMDAIKHGAYLNATQYKQDLFKGSIEKLSRVEFRGNLNVTGTRKIVKDLREWYNPENSIFKAPEGSNKKTTEFYDEYIADILDTLANGVGGFSNQELSALNDVMDYFIHFIEHYNKVKRNGEYVEAKPIAEDFIKIIRRNKTTKKVGWFRKFINKYMTLFSDNETVVKYMDGYEDGFYTTTFNNLREACIEAEVKINEISEPLRKFYKENKNFIKEMETRTVKYQGHDIPLAQAMLFYMTLNREQAHMGLAKSGFSYVDKKTGDTVHLEGFALEDTYSPKEIKEEADRVKIKLSEQFTKLDKQYIALAEKIFNEDCKKLKEKADIERKGYSNVLEGYYVPIRRGNIAHSVDSSIWAEADRTSKASFNQETVKGAKNELAIEPLDVVLHRHIKGIALYSSLATCIDEYNLIFNLDVGGNANKPISVKVESENSWSDGDKFFRRLISDIQGIPSEASLDFPILSRIRSAYAKYQLGANPKVWLTQLSSLMSASSILDIDCIIKGLGVSAKGVDEYCALAKLRKDENTAAMAQGVMDKIDKAGDWLMKPIGKFDRIVVTRLFGACQVQIEKNEGLKVGSEDNKKRAGELLKEVIIKTQQNSLATERSAAMRSGNEILKASTMFSADSMKVIGRVIDSYGELLHLKEKRKKATDPAEIAELDKKIKSAKKNARKSTAALISSAVLMALIARFFRFLYNKDEEPEEEIKNIAFDAAGNLIGGLPIVRDVYSKLADGYDVDIYAYAAFNDLIECVDAIRDTSASIIQGKPDSRDIASTLRKMMYSAGQVLGIPTRNLYNVVTGLTRRVSPSSAYWIDDKFYKQSYSSDLAKAIERDDEDMIAMIAGLMLDENIGGIDDSSARKSLNELISAGYDVLPRSTPEKITYEDEEIKLSARERKTFKNIYSTANEALASLVKLSQYASATDEVKSKSVKFIYDVYYNLAVQDALGIELENKNVLFAEAIDIEKLALIISTAKSMTADIDKNGITITGTRKRKVQSYVNSLKLTAAQKYMIMGYLGYKNVKGEEKVKAFIKRLNLSADEKQRLLEYSGYAA